MMIFCMIHLSSINAKATEMDLFLNKGEKTPYTGFLIPKDHYQLLDSSTKELVSCESALAESVQSGISFGDYSVIFGLGTVFGILTYTVLKH